MKCYYLGVALAVMLGSNTLSAQSLIVQRTDNTTTKVSLDNARITFGTSSLILSDGTTSTTFPISSLAKVYFQLTTSTGGIETFSPLSLYPNPVRDLVQISGLEDDTILYVYALDGKLVLKASVEAGNPTANLSVLPAGTYIAQLNGQTAKILKL